MNSPIVDRSGIAPEEGIKAPCRVASVANLTLEGLQTVDDIDVVTNDRVLVKDNDNAAENGIYLAQTTAWVRASDWNDSRDVIPGMLVASYEGTVSGDRLWSAHFTGNYAVNTTEVTFTENAASDTRTRSVKTAPDLATMVADISNAVAGTTSYIIDERTAGAGGGAVWNCIPFADAVVNGFDVVAGDGSTKSFQLSGFQGPTSKAIADARQFGILGSGDETAAFEAMVDYLPSEGGIIEFGTLPEITVNSLKNTSSPNSLKYGVSLKSGLTIRSAAYTKVKTTATYGTALWVPNAASDITLDCVDLVGSAISSPPIEGQALWGLSNDANAYTCSNIKVINCKMSQWNAAVRLGKCTIFEAYSNTIGSNVFIPVGGAWSFDNGGYGISLQSSNKVQIRYNRFDAGASMQVVMIGMVCIFRPQVMSAPGGC